MSWIVLRQALKLSGDSWQTSMGRVAQTDCVRKEGLTVGVCVALDLHLLHFKSSNANRNWFQVISSRNGDCRRRDHYECDTA